MAMSKLQTGLALAAIAATCFVGWWQIQAAQQLAMLTQQLQHQESIQLQDRQHRIAISDEDRRYVQQLTDLMSNMASEESNRDYEGFSRDAIELGKKLDNNRSTTALHPEDGVDDDFRILIRVARGDLDGYLKICVVNDSLTGPTLRRAYCRGFGEVFLVSTL